MNDRYENPEMDDAADPEPDPRILAVHQVVELEQQYEQATREAEKRQKMAAIVQNELREARDRLAGLLGYPVEQREGDGPRGAQARTVCAGLPMTALADATDPRFTDGQRAHLARFEAAEVPAEVVEAGDVERVAAAIYTVDFGDVRPFDRLNGWDQERFRRYAAAAIAAIPASPADGRPASTYVDGTIYGPLCACGSPWYAHRHGVSSNTPQAPQAGEAGQ